MTEQQHPISPPKELVEQWCRNWTHAHGEFGVYLAIQAARWGADQELEACREWASQFNYDDYRYQDELRAARRPKSPSLAEDALKALQDQIDTSFKISSEAQERANTIRRALERLQELESNG